ncbi:MAG: transglycosylase SLT domain-containing protein [Methylococcaceae bacterium]
MNVYRVLLIRLLLALSGGFFVVPAFSADVVAQRLDFLQAERLLSNHKSVEFLAVIESISDYPLYPYLKSKWLKENLDQTEQIKQFLARYPDSRYANQVRVQWLDTLAKQASWQDVITYSQASDNVENQCLFNQARYLSGQQEVALLAAKPLWLLGEDLPPQCDFLLDAFKKSAYFSQALILERFDAALQKNKLPLAQHLKSLLDKQGKDVADFWLRLHSQPELIQSASFTQMPSDYQGRMVAYAVQRLIPKTPLLAAMIWDTRALELSLTAERQQQITQALALAFANNKLPGAFERLMQVTLADDDIKEWRVRVPLVAQNWVQVAAAIASLSTEEQAKSRWRYWQARAQEQLGHNDLAIDLFKQLALKSDYYGFLAADHVQLPYTFVDNPVQVEPQLKAALLDNEVVKSVQELRYHQRESEAQKQWWYMIKRLDKDNIKAAAKIAQEWQWQQMAIFTIAKAEEWDDLSLRFPVFYQQSVLDSAANNALDPALVFGLIRQESAFDQEAASPVGARGLMQIMPATGAQIAREMQEPWGSARSLLDPAVNIKYGTHYYSKLLQRFKGHAALAAAAYNAGPHRVSTWLPVLTGVSADIWVETIPFKETRKYVSSVLGYAMIYQQRLQREGLKLQDLMRDVTPS